MSAEASAAAGPSQTAPGAPPAADPLADDSEKGAAPRSGEEALVDAPDLSPFDSLEHSLEEEMARLLGRGP